MKQKNERSNSTRYVVPRRATGAPPARPRLAAFMLAFHDYKVVYYYVVTVTESLSERPWSRSSC